MKDDNQLEINASTSRMLQNATHILQNEGFKLETYRINLQLKDVGAKKLKMLQVQITDFNIQHLCKYHSNCRPYFQNAANILPMRDFS